MLILKTNLLTLTRRSFFECWEMMTTGSVFFVKTERSHLYTKRRVNKEIKKIPKTNRMIELSEPNAVHFMKFKAFHV